MQERGLQSIRSRRIRLRVVVLLSSLPSGERKSEIMQINGKKKERLGQREEKGLHQRFYCILNYRFSETEIPNKGQLLVNLSTTKTSQSQRSPIFMMAPTYAAHGKQTWSVDCTLVSKWKPRSSREPINGLISPCFCGT